MHLFKLNPPIPFLILKGGQARIMGHGQPVHCNASLSSDLVAYIICFVFLFFYIPSGEMNIESVDVFCEKVM